MKPYGATREQAVQRLRDAGWAVKDIAEAFGMNRAEVTRASIRATIPPDATPWLSTYQRAFLDGVLAVQGYALVQMEAPR